MPPFELFGHVLWRDGGMWRILRRLSHEAVEPLEAFLDLALQHEQIAQPSLEAFIRWLERDAPEIKREQEGNPDIDDGPGEVRVMTVHGAKGLESPVVFLADTVRTPDKGKLGLIEIAPASDAPLPGAELSQRLPLWTLSSAQRPEKVEELVRLALERQEEEYNRLLYVAMTRAGDRLIVCGAESRESGNNNDDGDGKKSRKKNDDNALKIVSWYERVANVLKHDAYAVRLEGGRTIWRYPPDAQGCRAEAPPRDDVELKIPGWLLAPARPEPGPAEWIAPSKLAAPGMDEAPSGDAAAEVGAAFEEPVLSPLSALRAGANNPLNDPFRRGQLIHKLLQYLPGAPPEQREQRALGWLKHTEPGLSEQQRHEIWAEVKGVMEDARFAPLFGSGSQAEVPFATRMGDLLSTDAATARTSTLLSGQIDRLVVTENEVLLADFKTARPVPEDIKDVPQSYIRQLALYRLAMRQVWPDKPIRCALLFTAGPKWLEIPQEMLHAAARDVHALLR